MVNFTAITTNEEFTQVQNELKDTTGKSKEYVRKLKFMIEACGYEKGAIYKIQKKGTKETINKFVLMFGTQGNKTLVKNLSNNTIEIVEFNKLVHGTSGDYYAVHVDFDPNSIC